MAGPDTLEHVVNFIGQRPKLRAPFVHDIMRFESFAKRGTRTFYRAGENEAWLGDVMFCEVLRALPDTEQAVPQYAARR